MRLSVIIPTLNEAAVIGETLRQVAALDVDEIIVVDGGSRDDTKAVVESVVAREPGLHGGRIRLITSPAGRAQQMNAGAEASSGDALLFLHADTQLPSDAPLRVSEALRGGAVGGRFDVRFEQDAGWGWLISRLMNVRSRWSGIATGDQALFVRRDAFHRLGGFADLPIMEDIDFTRRLKRLGPTAALRRCVVTSYRRWAARGPLRTIVLMWSLRSLYWIGVPPRRLARLYADVR